MRADLPIIVSTHASERAFERFSPFPDRVDQALTLIRGDVRDALREGRCAKNSPAGARGSRPRLKVKGSSRLVWTENSRRAYVVAQRRAPDRPERAIVVVITSLDLRAAAA